VVGQVVRRRPTRRDFVRLTKTLAIPPRPADLRRIKSAAIRVPVVSKQQVAAMRRIVVLFARLLAEEASRCLMARRSDEPSWLASVRQFVHSADGEPARMTEAARRAHISPSHFCAVFKKTTGMTFTEYVARTRIEKAKTLLCDPFARVSEVAFAAGFGSIPQFNTVFRKLAGMTPTEYRASLQSDFHI